ncbi:paraquat-inducible protein A [Psychromonas sp. MB-3u-54]|uniref:paraquat-inducible protein A n=1 Tax=Psychromonas sp. MB-3u-54 TaxID=2058319 RepID=UPI000C321264|nr:paraquat-inducible protein A [Psychromonas sp. MB-3u-54]PKH01700.1 paraquat-inducible protein A [Psychromonas sp. MB-3u-54]
MKTIICRHCDMVSNVPRLPINCVAKCCRCGGAIYKNIKCSPSVLLALTLSALLIMVPAFYFPLISVNLLGITEDTNLLQGALMMLDNAPVVSVAVLFCAVIAPTLLLSCIAFSSACLTYNYFPAYLPKILHITHSLTHWSMLEVYMISLMVAIFKLMNYADLYIGSGFYFFITLMLLDMTIISNYSNHAYWERYINAD